MSDLSHELSITYADTIDHLEPRPDVERVRRFKEANGIGLIEARRILDRDWLIKCTKEAKTVNDLCLILGEVIARQPI